MNVEQFVKALELKGINLNEQQRNQFETYYKVLVEWNEKMNLTSIVAKEEVYLKHFYDSISSAFYFDFSKKLHICDVGAGAGFPSIPLKICFPNLHVSIVDSLKKRIGFLHHLQNELNIDHVSFYHDRAETFGQNVQFREKFDIVMARAVARMTVLSELCLPLVKPNGVFIAMKSAQTEAEYLEAAKAIRLLGGEKEKIETFHLPVENSERTIVFVKKCKKTPKKYPRKPGLPNRSPII
ncbi:16S rRNA (guanine(527)-N(7))-methyltransferase RsmG [Virgibacillus sp. W0430]|uniref:16S rRNA (guanine(527)-N(7))-methyltransferase RsmG n=1 Tax=Virgibacillus sp. W0430 TaxID=3391580 RepID=UPI003F488753